MPNGPARRSGSDHYCSGFGRGISREVWASPALPGAVHDVRAAREHDIVDVLAEAGVPYWADKETEALLARSASRAGGAGHPLCRPAGGKPAPCNRALVEQIMATLKSWRLLRKP